MPSFPLIGGHTILLIAGTLPSALTAEITAFLLGYYPVF
jgi:hypothetical protein